MSPFSFLMKKMYGKFNLKLFPLVSYYGCYFAFAYLWLIKKKNQIILAPTSAIGDLLYPLSFLQSMDAWTKEKNKKILFYVSDRYKDIIETFEKPNSRIEFVFLKHCGLMHLFLLMTGGCKDHPKLNSFSKNSGILMPIPNVCKSFFLHKDKPKGSRQQLSVIFGLPLSPVSLHNLPSIEINSIENFEKKKQKICILNPYSYSMYTPQPLFETLSNELKNKNYIVYTNVVHGQKEIQGTIPLECSLRELYSIAKQIPLIVSLRSGILDFLIPSGISMFVIYDKWKSDNTLDTDYTIEEWTPQGKLCEVSTKSMPEEDIVRNFQKFLHDLEVAS